MSGVGRNVKRVLIGGTLALAGAAVAIAAPALAGDGAGQSTQGGSGEEVGIGNAFGHGPGRGAFEDAPFINAVHGDLDLILVDGSTRSLAIDRGEITAVSDAEIVVLRPDGVSVTLAVDQDTVVRDGFRIGTVVELEVGERAMFVSEPTADGGYLLKLVRCLLGPLSHGGLGL